MYAFSFLLKEMSQWPGMQWKLASKTNEATLKSSWRSTPRRGMDKTRKNEEKKHQRCLQAHKEKNEKWMEPSATYTKRTISRRFGPLRKDKERTIRPVTKDDYRPEADISETVEWVKISVNLIKNRMCQPRQPQHGYWAAWKKKRAIILVLNVSKCYQWRKLYNQEWERM